MTAAYAAIEHGTTIVPDTVSKSDSQSMRKWLSCRAGYAVPDGMGDFAMRDQFARQSQGVVEIARVILTRDTA
jgi:hypothetical protein